MTAALEVVEPPAVHVHDTVMHARPPGLDDPDYARFAWARFRTLLAWMITVGAACSGVVIAVMTEVQGPLHIVTMLAVLGGVAGSITMAGALMGLVFLSSGSGHDEDVESFNE